MKLGYRGLKVYEKSYKLFLDMYEFTKKLPKEEMYGITSQMRRAALSVPLNIAEGYGRKANSRAYRQFLYIARGSCNEMQVLVDAVRDLGFVNQVTHDDLFNRYEEILRMLTGLIEKLNLNT